VRDFLTGLAVAVILLFTAALALPHFVDWTAHRDRVERELAASFGLPVRISGGISLRLLPSPVLKLGGVSLIGGRPDDPTLSADGVSLEIAAAPLLRGEIRVIDAVLDGARLDLSLDEAGRIAGLGLGRPGREAAIAVERFVIRRSALFVRDVAGGPGLLMSGIDAEARAAALTGPWRISGRGVVSGRAREIRLSTGEREPDGGFRFRLALIEGEASRYDLDGRVGPDGIETSLRSIVRLRLPGPDGPIERTVTASARSRTVGRTVMLDDVALETGEEHGLKLTGKGLLDLRPGGGLALDLEARTLDLDRVAGERGPQAAGSVLRGWSEALLRAAADMRTTRIGLTVPALLVGGDTIRDLFLSVRSEGRVLRVEGLKAGLPGGAAFAASGEVRGGTGPGYAGTVSLSATDARRLAAWWAGDAGARPPGSRPSRLDFRGDVSLAPDLLAGRIETLALDGTTLSGVIRFVPGEAGARDRLQAQISAERIAVEDLPDLSVLARAYPRTDATLVLDARNVGLARPGIGAGRLVARLSSGASGLDIDTLELTDIAGATLRAGGRLAAEGGRITAELDARRPEPLADLLERVAPGAVASFLSARAQDLGPLKLALSAERAAGASAPVLFTLTGTAGGTSISANGDWPWASGPAAARARLEATSGDAARLLRQLGLRTLPLPLGGQARFSLTADMPAGMMRAELGMPGALLRSEFSSLSAPQGSLFLEGDDWGPLLQTVGVPVPDPSIRIPISARAAISSDSAGTALRALEATVAGRRIAGELRFLNAPGRIEGRIETDRIALATLTGFTLGPAPPVRPGALWSSTRFGAVPPPLFETAIALRAERLDLPAGPAPSDALISLTWNGERFGLDLVAAALGGGTVAGSLNLRRDGGRIGATGRLALKAVQAGALFGHERYGSALVDLDLDGGSTGESPAGLVTALSGAGRLVLRDLVLPALDPGAPVRAAEEAEAAGLTDGRRIREVAQRALDSGPFRASDPTEIPVAFSGGVMKFGAFAPVGGAATLQGAASFEIGSGRFDLRAVLASNSPPPGWPAPPPEIGIRLHAERGEDLRREIDAGLLANLLTTRAVQRELERIEAMEIDMRERAFFLRRLRADRERAEAERKAAEDAAKAEAIRLLGGSAPSVQFPTDPSPALPR
jgi:hypothetical protein